MNRRLNELHLRRGRLLERIANQRAALGREVQPVRAALDTMDRMLVRVRSVTDYVKQHPGIAALAGIALFVMKPGRVWRWSRRALAAWQTWRIVQDKLLIFGLRARS